jgi:hypothetical protein
MVMMMPRMIRPSMLLATDQAVVDEDARAQDHQQDEQVLDDVVGNADRAIDGEQAPEIEIRIVAPSPQHHGVQQQHVEPQEDQDVGDAGSPVIGHLPLADRVDERVQDARAERIARDGEAGLGGAHHQQPPAPDSGPRKQAHQADDNHRHRYRVHDTSRSWARTEASARDLGRFIGREAMKSTKSAAARHGPTIHLAARGEAPAKPK